MPLARSALGLIGEQDDAGLERLGVDETEPRLRVLGEDALAFAEDEWVDVDQVFVGTAVTPFGGSAAKHKSCRTRPTALDTVEVRRFAPQPTPLSSSAVRRSRVAALSSTGRVAVRSSRAKAWSATEAVKRGPTLGSSARSMATPRRT